VDGERGVGLEVRDPVTPARCARDEEPAVDVEHPDLDPARLPAATTGRRDVDGGIIGEFGAHHVHVGSVGARSDPVPDTTSD
jgi:hypothetical protein